MSRTLDIPTAEVFEPLLGPSRYKGLYGGRGGAKSHFFGDHLIDRALSRKGHRAVCIREYQVSLEQSVKRLLEDKINGYGLAGDFRVMDSVIETPGEGIIIFQGMQSHNAESIKSLEGYDVAWVEEAQNLSQRSLDLLRPTIRKETCRHCLKDGTVIQLEGAACTSPSGHVLDPSELWFSWNPRHATDPIDQFLRNNPPPDAIVIRSSYRDNPFYPEVLRKEMEWDRARDPEKYAHVWLGEYERHSEARVFKNWKVEEFETPDDANFLYGADWGYSIDPAVLIRMRVEGRKLYIDRECYKIGVEIDHLPVFFDQIPGSRNWTIIADSARPETISYMNRNGFPKLIPAIKGKDSVKEGIIFLQGYDIVIHPRCIHTIDEFTMYSFKTDKLTGLVTPILEDRKNHVIDSCRYAVERMRLNILDWQKSGMTSAATW